MKKMKGKGFLSFFSFSSAPPPYAATLRRSASGPRNDGGGEENRRGFPFFFSPPSIVFLPRARRRFEAERRGIGKKERIAVGDFFLLLLSPFLFPRLFDEDG